MMHIETILFGFKIEELKHLLQLAKENDVYKDRIFIDGEPAFTYNMENVIKRKEELKEQ